MKTIKFNFDKLAKHGYVVPTVKQSRIAEEFRLIKRPLLNLALKNKDGISKKNIIMVTSAVEGEGKTYIAINLSISIAMEIDKTALLIDANIHNSSASKFLGLDGLPGLTDYLVNDKIALVDVMYKTNVEKLVVMPVGSIISATAELFSSGRMERLIDELSEQYPDRVIIFDLPGIKVASEAYYLSEMAGQIAFIVSAGTTSRFDVDEAINQIGKNKQISLILNKASGSTVRML